MLSRVQRLFLSAALVAAAFVACSGSAAGVGLSPTQACSDLASSICNRLDSCAPFYVTLAYGSVSQCTMRAAVGCPNVISANGSGATASDVEACARAYTAASCADLESNSPPSACQIAGTLAAGAVCGTGQQCVGPSGYCKIASTAVCGACATQSAAGGPCTANGDCQSGLVCGTATGATMGACVSPGAAGAMCDAGHPCQATLACSKTTCSPPGQAGAACDPTGQNCDLTQGLFCNPTSKVCAQVQTAAAGGSCGYSASTNTYTLCANGATCNGATGTKQGTCGAVAADGAACGSNMATCMAPAICVNDVCTLPDASSCQ
jgi:hypothetical protein